MDARRKRAQRKGVTDFKLGKIKKLVGIKTLGEKRQGSK